VLSAQGAVAMDGGSPERRGPVGGGVGQPSPVGESLGRSQMVGPARSALCRAGRGAAP